MVLVAEVRTTAHLFVALDGPFVTLHQAPVARDVVAPNCTKTRNVSAPVSVKLRGNSCPVEQLAASLSHPFVGGLPRVLGKCARSISNNEDIISLLNQTKGWKGNADFRQNTTVIMLDPFSPNHAR